MRLNQWFAIVGTLSGAGLLFGWGIGMLLSALSGDYVVTAPDYARLGLRVGLLAGTVAAAWHAITRQHRWGLLALCRALGTAGLVASGVIGLVAVLAALLSLLALLSALPGVVPEYANLAHPRRYVVFVAIHHFWPYALIFGIILSGLRHARGRLA